MKDKALEIVSVGAIAIGVGISVTEFIFLHRFYERRKNMKLGKKENLVREVRSKGTETKETNIRITIPESADVKDIVEKVRNVRQTSMTKLERDEWIKRIKGMSKEELELIVEYVPVEMCLNRIAKEIDKAKAFERKVEDAISSLESKVM